MIIFNNQNVTVFQSAIFKMNSTVVETEDLILVADPGFLPNEIREIRQFVDSIKQEKPVFLFFTHSDFDHIVGNGAFPDAETIASRQFVDNHDKNKQIEDIIHFDHEMYIDRGYTVDYPKINIPIVNDGQKLKVGKTMIKFYHTFGHTGDGLFAVIEDINLLLAGDYLSDLEFPFVYHSYQEYENTLVSIRRMINNNKSKLILIPGHGSVTVDRDEIKKRIKASEDYLLLVKNTQSEGKVTKFLLDQGYNYKTNLLKRHQENLMIWKKDQR